MQKSKFQLLPTMYKIIFLIIILAITQNPIKLFAVYGDGSWLYRKLIPLNPSDGAGTNYQVKILVGENAGTGGTNVNLDGHSLSAGVFDDVRFTDNDGNTELSYWRESVTGTAPNRIATFWVKVTDTLDPVSEIMVIGRDPLQCIYIYYGNASAVNVSSGPATFAFFDDFNRPDSSTIGNGWTTVIGNPTISSGKLRMTMGEAPPLGEYISRPSTLNVGAWEFLLQIDSTLQTTSNVGLGLVVSGAKKYHLRQEGANTNKFKLYDEVDLADVISVDKTADTSLHKIKMTRDSSGNWTIFLDNVQQGSTTQDTTTTLFDAIWFQVYGNTEVCNVDDFRVRKYASPEPTPKLKVGNEERVDLTPPATIASINDGTGADITYTTSTTELSANWTASSDPESGIAKYWYAIGTSPGATDKVDWTDNGLNISVTKGGLTLTNGQTYYFSVKAENGFGVQNTPTNSDGQTVDSTEPAIDIIQPLNNALLRATTNIIALATDSGSGVAEVGFYLDGVHQSSATVSPYQWSWNTTTVSDGNHTLLVRALDSAGNTQDSIGHSVTVDNTLPTVSITQPDNNALLSGTTMVIAAANDTNLKEVGFYLDGVLQSAVQASPHQWSWNTKTTNDGSHTLIVRALDWVGNSKDSDSISVTVDNTLPTASITQPVNNALIRGTTTITVNGSDTNMQEIGLYINGVLKSSATAEPYQWVWDTTGSDDENYQLIARALDRAGNIQDSPGITVIVDNTLPAVNITQPANNALLSGTTVVIAAASDTNLKEVGFYLDGVHQSSATVSPYQWSWTGAEGGHQLMASALDKAGNLTSSSVVSVTIDNTAPLSPNLVYPPNGLVLATNNPQLEWQAVTDKISGLDHYRLQMANNANFNPSQIDNFLVNNFYSAVLSETTYYWRVKAVDQAGNESNWSAVRSVIIDTTAPTAPELILKPNSVINKSSATFSYSSVEGEEYSHKLLLIGTTVEDWTAWRSEATTIYSNLNNGVYNFVVKSRDWAGNESKESSYSWQVEIVPTNPSPVNNASGLAKELTLGWELTDRRAVDYDIYFGPSELPAYLATQKETFYKLAALTAATTYYWKIIARDDNGFIGEGPVWKFITLKEEIKFPISETQLVDPRSEETITLKAESGDIKVDIPPATFTDPVNVTVTKITTPAADTDKYQDQGITLKETDVSVEITTDKGIQPQGELTITIYYRDSDVIGFDETKLIIGRYDEINSRWIRLPSQVYPEQNCVVARTDRLSKFAILQFLLASNLSLVKVFPNPFNPRQDGAGLTFDNLTGQAEIKIYTISGELVREVVYNSEDGRAYWDGKNEAGEYVASGIYIGLIKNEAGKKIIKIAVER